MKKILVFTMAILFVSISHPQAGYKKAPGFALTDNNGGFVYMSKLKGNLLISFWASYCVPCKKEMPELITLEQKYGKDKNLSLILINVDKSDSGKNARDKAIETLEEIDVKHDFLLDMYHVTLGKYNPKKSVPCTFLVNASGDIVFSEIGSNEDTLIRLEQAIKRLR